MSKLKNYVGEIIHNVKIVMRVENYEGDSDSRSQWLIECLICNKEQKIVGRELTRYRSRFKKGCYECGGVTRTANVKNYTFGRNQNGFIDRSIVIQDLEMQ